MTDAMQTGDGGALTRCLRFFLENKLIAALLALLFVGAGVLVAPFPWEIEGLRRGETVTLVLEGVGDVELEFDDIEIRRQEKEGLAVANEGQITVALDLQLDPELLNEGLAREVINRVQNLRKEKDFDVSDRIVVDYCCPDEVEVAIDAHRTYISCETLADTLQRCADTTGLDNVDINDLTCGFRLTRVG